MNYRINFNARSLNCSYLCEEEIFMNHLSPKKITDVIEAALKDFPDPKVTSASNSRNARFEAAVIFANRIHAGQLRKGKNTPYIAHLLAVAGIAMEYGADEDETIAALLHDAIEDGGGAEVRDKIRDQFGETVLKIVEECTDTDQDPKPPWMLRKKAYIEHIKKASKSGRLISAADKLHNARASLADFRVIGDELWERFNAGREDILWYYRALVDAFKEHEYSPLIGELDLVVCELEETVKKR